MGPSPSLHSVGNAQFEMRQMHSVHNDVQQPSKNDVQNFMPSNPSSGHPPVPQQVNVVQRISGIIKSQLNVLQGVLSYVDKKTNE